MNWRTIEVPQEYDGHLSLLYYFLEQFPVFASICPGEVLLRAEMTPPEDYDRPDISLRTPDGAVQLRRFPARGSGFHGKDLSLSDERVRLLFDRTPRRPSEQPSFMEHLQGARLAALSATGTEMLSVSIWIPENTTWKRSRPDYMHGTRSS